MHQRPTAPSWIIAYAEGRSRPSGRLCRRLFQHKDAVRLLRRSVRGRDGHSPAIEPRARHRAVQAGLRAGPQCIKLYTGDHR